jgi:hypothetical protein
MDHRYYDRCQTVELTEYSHALSRNEGTRSTRQELCRTPSCIHSDRTRKTLCFCLKVSSGPRSAGISHPDASAELQELPALNTLGASGKGLFSPSNWPPPSLRLGLLAVREYQNCLN